MTSFDVRQTNFNISVTDYYPVQLQVILYLSTARRLCELFDSLKGTAQIDVDLSTQNESMERFTEMKINYITVFRLL